MPVFLSVDRMSQIAAALARSKGKKVDPVPGEVSIVPSIPTLAPALPAKAPPAKPGKFPVKLAVGVAVIVLALGGWLIFRPKAPSPATKPAASVPVAVKQPSPASVRAPVPPGVVRAPVPPAPLELPAPAPVVGLAPELEDQLRKLTITARRAGSEPRIVVGRKVYVPGDVVIPGVILEAVLPDLLVFRDAENHRFERRF
jgi:hypothetical protein